MSDLLNTPPVSHDRIHSYVTNLVKLQQEQIEKQSVQIQANEQHAKQRNLAVTNTINKLTCDTATKIQESDVTNRTYVPAEPKFMAVILLRSKNKMSAKLKKVCELFRLESINTLVLVKNNESNRNMLKVIKDYVAYGFVSFEMLREILVKRGKGRSYDKRTSAFDLKKINSNTSLNRFNIFLEESEVQKAEKLRKKRRFDLVNLSTETITKTFNDSNLKTIDDIALHLFTGSEYFKLVNNFLVFTLNCPRGGFKHRKKGQHYVDGGILGNWYYEIEGLIRRMID